MCALFLTPRACGVWACEGVLLDVCVSLWTRAQACSIKFVHLCPLGSPNGCSLNNTLWSPYCVKRQCTNSQKFPPS